MRRALRIIGVVAVIALIIGAIAAGIVSSMNQKTSNADRIWDKQMTVGNEDAENYFIIYSDIACPYCLAFENAIIEHEDEYLQYLENNDILVEVRLADYMYEYGESRSIESRYSAEAIYCAKKQNKFWDYYNHVITTVWNDYFKTMGKNAFSDFNKLEKDYWIKLGKQVGLDNEEFANCVNNDETLDEVKAAANKMLKLVTGMPHFKFNNYTTGGFNLSWGWEYVLMFFQSGLDSK